MDCNQKSIFFFLLKFSIREDNLLDIAMGDFVSYRVFIANLSEMLVSSYSMKNFFFEKKSEFSNEKLWENF
jgi:hypothetical protein